VKWFVECITNVKQKSEARIQKKGDFIIYDPFDFAQDMFINTIYYFIRVNLRLSAVNSNLKKQTQ